MTGVRPAVVFDCNVFLQAIARTTGPSAACLRLLERNLIYLYLSPAVLEEVRLILRSPILRDLNPALTDDAVDAFLMRLAFRAELIREVLHVFDHPRDPKDEPYVDLAVAAGAELLVTRDRDLLDLMTGHDAASKSFRQRFPKLRVIDPSDLLSIVRERFPDESIDA